MGQIKWARLRDLIEERGETREEFAYAVGASGRNTVDRWLGGELPSGRFLVAIAEKTGVSVDWLLGLRDAPQSLDHGRTASDLAEDLAGYVSREVRRALGRNKLPVPVDGRQLLREAVENEADRVRRTDAASDRRIAGLNAKLGHAVTELETARERIKELESRPRRASSRTRA